MTHPPAFLSLHCGIVTSRFAETCEFYAEHFGFDVMEVTPEYALLAASEHARLAVLCADGDGQPAALRQPTRGAGTWLTFESDDVDAVHVRLAQAGVEIVADPEYTLSGQRRCVARDPNGVLLYICARRAAPCETPADAASRPRASRA